MSKVGNLLMKPSQLLKIIRSPLSGQDVILKPSLIKAGEPAEGIILDSEEVVGKLSNGKFDFLLSHTDKLKLTHQLSQGLKLPEYIDLEFKKELLHFSDSRLTYDNSWRIHADRLLLNDGFSSSNKLTIESSKAINCHILFHAHPWSGFAQIKLDGVLLDEIDLFNPGNSMEKRYEINLDDKHHYIEIIPTNKKSKDSQGTQVIFEKIYFVYDEKVPITEVKENFINYGNPFPQIFVDLAKNVASDGVILDVGGGIRQLGDERYVNVEYSKYPQPHVFADAENLPFKDNCVDLVLCQGMLEHVSNPFKVAEEIYRILKPNGYVYADMAFMQPVHSQPYHYFNATLWGMESLFKKFRKIECSSFGKLSEVIEWILRESGVRKYVKSTEYESVISQVKSWDSLVKDDRLVYVASGIRFVGQKG